MLFHHSEVGFVQGTMLCISNTTVVWPWRSAAPAIIRWWKA